MNLNDVAIDKFKNDLKTELKVELKDEIVGALKPHFEIINTQLDKVDRRLGTIEEHMGRHCKEIQKIESTIKGHSRILRSHDIALRKLIKEE